MAGWASLKGRLFGELLRRTLFALVRDRREDAVRRRAELVRDLLVEVRLERHAKEEERRARDLREVCRGGFARGVAGEFSGTRALALAARALARHLLRDGGVGLDGRVVPAGERRTGNLSATPESPDGPARRTRR